MKLLQVSDPHFGTERPEVLSGLLAFARSLQPDVVVLSGDITQRATVAQFAAGRRFADALTRRADGTAPIPLFAIPGNHDLPLVDLVQRLLWPYARFQEAFGPALEQTWDAPWLQLTTLDSTSRWRHEDGQLSKAQIERVAQRLRLAAPQQLRLVVAHHPLAVQRPQDRENLMRGHAAALRCWAEAGADLVMGGHIHLPFVVAAHQQDAGIAAPLWVVQAGTAVSARVRHEADNSVNVLHVDSMPKTGVEADAGAAGRKQRHCRVERWDWQPAAGVFGCVHTHALACGAPS